jgi:ribosomal protein S18 acetylase RimI-like enzyme
MTAPWLVRPAQADDFSHWLVLWRAYCASLDHSVSDEVSEGIWSRILNPSEPIWCLVASRAGDEPQGFANYILHPHTWSLRMVCYLEDIFVAPQTRGRGAGRALIDKLVALGRQEGWRRVYWHTHENNSRARALYDRVVERTDYVRYDIDL